MEFKYIGDIVNTHGIKGEVRILSDIKFKEEVFKVGNKFYVGNKKEELEVTSHRVHKGFNMVTFKGITNINDVLIYKSEKVYIDASSIDVDGYFTDELIGMDVVFNGEVIGIVNNVLKSKAHDIICVEGSKKCLIPDVDAFVDEVNLDTNTITVIDIEGLINEN